MLLKQQDPPQVAVTVLDRLGSPARGAMVFFEEAGKGTRLLVTGADGRAMAGLEAPQAARVRAGASVNGSFALGDWTGLDDARQGLVVQLGESGGIVIRSVSATGSVRIVLATGWDLSLMMRFLGMDTGITPAKPLRIEGAPPGAYKVILGPSEVQVNIRPGSDGQASLP
jgi:hypothetical protein